jgi:Uma2 family endonuclease
MMKVMATTTLMSFADFERLDAGADHLELLKGKLVRVPPPVRSHMEICRRLFRHLDDFVERQRSGSARIGTVYFEMGYRLQGKPQSWLRPDVSLNHPEQSGEPYFDGAPLLVFEVVSEHDTAQQLNSKVTEYLANGSREVWLLYPAQRHALVYGPGDAIRKESQAIRTDLLPGLEVPLDRVL